MFDLILTDLIVLAEDALEVAVGEENIADSGFSRDRGFFSPVHEDGGYVILPTGPAVAVFSGLSSDPAVAGAESAEFSIYIRGVGHISTHEAGLFAVNGAHVIT